MILRRLALGLALAGAARGADVARYFQPWHGDGAVLAPDGRHLAYIRADGPARDAVVMVDCDSAAETQTGDFSAAAGSSEQLHHLIWIDAAHLSAETAAGGRLEIEVPSGRARPVKDLPGPHGAGPRDQVVEALQRAIEQKFPARTVEVTSWDSARQRAVALVAALDDPGRYFLYDRGSDLASEFVRRAPRLPRSDRAQVYAWSGSNHGEPSAGILALPRVASTGLLPVVIFCRGSPLAISPRPFEREVQALAATGSAVLEVDEAASETDLRRALATLADQYPLDVTRAAAVGIGRGGDLAAWVARNHPENFRCAVSIDGGPAESGAASPRPVLYNAPGYDRANLAARAAEWNLVAAFLAEHL